MNIFIDESGTFVNAKKPNSWNSIAAYTSPESDRRHIRKILGDLKRSTGALANTEVKLRDVEEAQYFKFLEQLGKHNGVLFSVATDAGLNQEAGIAAHQRIQAAKIIEHKDKMLHQSAKDGLQTLSQQVAELAPQLYIQLQCQIQLIDNVIRYGTLYFVQRMPKHLGYFRWRIDQKNSERTVYESAFLTVLPAFLQSRSLRDPFIMLKDADYSAFSRFDYTKENRPTYLQNIYGLDVNESELATNIGMLVREKLEFVDSKQNQGVQIADLLVSGIRRCLRQGFEDNKTAAHLLGRLMVNRERRYQPIQFLGFTDEEIKVSDEVARLSKIMEKSCRSLLT